MKNDYRALIATGKIMGFSDLLTFFRQDLIDSYTNTIHWPEYVPTIADTEEFGHLYSIMDLSKHMPFSVFVQIFKSKETE